MDSSACLYVEHSRWEAGAMSIKCPLQLSFDSMVIYSIYSSMISQSPAETCATPLSNISNVVDEDGHDQYDSRPEVLPFALDRIRFDGDYELLR